MLSDSNLTAFLTVSDAHQARAFYRDTLGLPLVHEDDFALVFDAHGVSLRVSLLQDFHPQPFTVLGWQVEDAASMSQRLQQAGIAFKRYPSLTQDKHALWRAPGGSLVGWFRDPFGNLLSIEQPPTAR